MRDAAYNVEDPDCLQEALKNLAQVHSSLLSKIPNEGGLRMRTSPAKKRLKVTTMDYHKVFHKKLPLRRKKKTLKSRKNIDSKSTTTIIINSSLESSPEKVRIKLEIVLLMAVILQYHSVLCCMSFHFHPLFKLMIS